MTMIEPRSLANSARSYMSSIVAAVTFRYEPFTSPVAALALLTASITYRKRSRQCMNGCELMFSSSFMKSRPPFRPS